MSGTCNSIMRISINTTGDSNKDCILYSNNIAHNEACLEKLENAHEFEDYRVNKVLVKVLSSEIIETLIKNETKR